MMWPFSKKPAPARAQTQTPAQRSAPAAAPTGRKGDGTILGDLIKKGAYTAAAGSEKIGHFNPACAPFRTYPNGKTGLMAGQLADQLLQMLRQPGVASSMMSMGMSTNSNDLAVELGRRLSLSSCQNVLQTFQELAKNDAIGKYLIVTTTMPFFLTYSAGQKVVIAEVEHELRLNSLANLLLNDPDFTGIYDPTAFSKKAASLLESRKEEVERMKQWAIDKMK